MHDLDRSGELRGTADQLAVDARCSAVEVVQALTDLQTTGAADVTERNGVWQICNRRMRADYFKRKANAERQMRHRISSRDGPNNGDISLYDNDIEIVFELFWTEFPSGRKNSKAKAREAFEKALAKASAETITAAAKEYAASEVGRGKFVKMPSTWLNQECWNDDREAWRDKDKPQAEGAYREITSEEFTEHWRMQRFKDKPTRHASNPNWVFGTLRDGSKVECKEYKK